MRCEKKGKGCSSDFAFAMSDVKARHQSKK